MAVAGETFDRLHEEQLKGIEETNERISKFNQFKDDYVALQSRLQTLPDKVSHDVMVPFGKLAFMPGRLVHTNEILVLLGDNWFADRSAKQACGIVDRRIKEIDNTIEGLKKQCGLLEPRADITQELQDIAGDQSGVVEIKEEYDDDKEKKWREKHRIRVRQSHQHTAAQEKTDKYSAMTDEELWTHLDQLELKENSRNELSKLSDEQCKSHDQKVHWGQIPSLKNNAPYIASSDEEYTDASDDENDGVDTEHETRRPVNTITFTHTKPVDGYTDSCMPYSAGASYVDDEKSITSPADIYKQFCPKRDCPKSILKRSSENNDTSQKQTHFEASVAKDNNIYPSMGDVTDRAFTETVVEHKLDTSDEQSSDLQPVKRVSKFKAQRMQQKR